MLYGKNINGEKVLASPKIKANCPICNKKIIPKCGSINIWHWAHESLKDCDTWYEPETKWHMDWKSLIDSRFTEVTIKNHRADIFNGVLFIELQNSPISSEEIKERESFYKKMIWIFNGEKFLDNFELRKYYQKEENYRSFRWKHPKKSLWSIKKRLYIDFGKFIFKVEKMYNDIPCGGYGYVIDKQYFELIYLKNVMKKRYKIE